VKIIEQILDLLLGFTLAKARSLLTLSAILLAVAWLVDWKTDYSEFSRLERAITLTERIDALERRGSSSKDLSALRTDLTAQLQALVSKQAERPFQEQGERLWFATWWAKGIAGALPWLLLAVIAIPVIRKMEKTPSWAVFAALQLYSLAFALINVLIPAYGKWWIDLILVPVGVLIVIVLILATFAVAVPAFRSVRDSSLRKAILNNLRQISAAADQHFLENGVSRVAFSELVGPGKYLKSIVSVDGERYDDLVLEQGRAIMVKRKSGEVVTLPP
jgi:type IV pilus assembly protein PilA